MPDPDHLFARAPFHRTLGVEVLESKPLRAVLAMTVTPGHAQAFGLTHGGVIATLLDTAAACACHATLPPGTEFTSTDFSVQFLRPVPPGRMTATAEVLKAGRRRLVVDALARDAQDRVCARYVGGFLTIGD